ncbi:hypothetical protein [Methylomonas sp. AM2-LC]|uniref:hypothetical protein n=1 Tax=Methylomonas sp. AM2-LC TaxID=3153301 RepID=UPI00326564EB
MDSSANVKPILADTLDNLSDFDHTLKALLNAYQQLADSTVKIAFFSLRPLITLYWQILLWELCLCFSPFVLIVHLIRTITARLFGLHLKQRWGWRICLKVAAPFIAVHHGNVNICKILTMRSLVRLFIYHHIRANLSLLILNLQELKVQHFLQCENTLFDPKWFDERISLLKDYQESAAQKLGYALLSSVVSSAGMFGIFKTAFEMLPEPTKLQLINVLNKLMQPLLASSMTNVANNATTETEIFVLIGTTTIYLLFAIVTNFIIKQSVMNTTPVFEVETHLFKSLGQKSLTTFPVDIVGLILTTIGLFFVKSISDANGIPNLSTINHDDLTTYSALSLILFYTLLRRFWLNRQRID